MRELAYRRVDRRGWRNVMLIAAPAESAVVPASVDAVLFCAVHDVMQSPAALDNVFARARPRWSGEWTTFWRSDCTR